MILINNSNNSEIDRLLSELNTASIIALDTETTGLDPHSSQIVLLQLQINSKCWIIDTFDIPAEIIQKILITINNNKIIVVIHNAVFDYKMILKHYNIELENMFCTYLAALLLSGGKRGFGAGLEDVLDRWLNIKISKIIRKNFISHIPGTPFSTEELEYAENDVKYLLPLRSRLMEELIKRNMEELIELEMETIKVTGEMELYGITIDTEKWTSLAGLAAQNAKTAELQLNKFFENDFSTDLFGQLNINYNSPKQLKPVLEKILNISLESTNETYLKTFDHPVLDALFEYRKWNKLVTTYGKSFLNKYINPVTGKLHTSLHQLGTDTGRYSSQNPNLQNIPKEQIYRDPFIASKKNRFIISADFSGQELRLLAFLSQEPKFLNALKNKYDLHAYSASLIFDVNYKDFFLYNSDGSIDTSQDPDGFNPMMKKKYRTPAKEITFGLIYGMGPYKLASKLKITIDDAKKLLHKYFEIFPNIKNLMDKLTQQLLDTKIALSPLDKRFRDLTTIDWINKKVVAHAINQSKNMPFQGCGASITKLAMCKIRKAIKTNNLDAKIVLTVHDEILIDVSNKDKDILAEITVKEMKAAFNHYAPSVEMDVTPKISDHWIH